MTSRNERAPKKTKRENGTETKNPLKIQASGGKPRIVGTRVSTKIPITTASTTFLAFNAGPGVLMKSQAPKSAVRGKIIGKGDIHLSPRDIKPIAVTRVRIVHATPAAIRESETAAV